jgi:hypothetical protein
VITHDASTEGDDEGMKVTESGFEFTSLEMTLITVLFVVIMAFWLVHP